MSFTHTDYTVAWICALPLEMAAAKIMLDEMHGPLYQLPTDHNAYTLGRLGDHNVAIACLPSGVYGTTSAATVLSHMLPTFPSLRFALMVGIGGGVPSENVDVRLGDVVVSMPNATSGGVIQYDYGKTLCDGYFQRTGSLNKPPQFLLTAVSQMRSNHMIGGRPIAGILSSTLQKRQELEEQFSRPDKDWLFRSTYDHQNSKPDCSTCDQTQLVNRAPRVTEEPQIHYGLIASGNQVMKDAKRRDSIAQEMDILCFEMEAAGLMDQYPCLVIRGISDYCDSHKHKEWQGYAALAAAAYTKLLLSVVPMTVPRTHSERKTEFNAEETACLASLFITDPEDDRNALKRRKGDRARGTCSWILETPELQCWLGLQETVNQSKSNILWLYGNPGTGKSTMAITLVEELSRNPYFTNRNKILAFFFCDSTVEKQRTAIAILRGLLSQLVKQSPELMKYLLPKYKERKEQLFSSFDALWAILIAMGQDISGVEIYCIIDALDECEPESQEILLKQIDQSFPRNTEYLSYRIHVLVTSRPYPEITVYLDEFDNKDLASYQEVREDLKAMIRERVDKLTRTMKYQRTVADKVSEILEDKAEGTFLWVGIACNELVRVPSKKAVQKLEGLPPGLHSLYQKLLDAAFANDEDEKQTINKILRFVTFAQRPLTVAELCAACELYPHEDVDNRLQFTKETIDLCRLMVIIQDEQVRLLHKSVKDFLQAGKHEMDELEVHSNLARHCINDIIDSYYAVGDIYFGPEKAFLDYGVQYWPIHAGFAGKKLVITQKQEAFFELDSRIWSHWLQLYDGLESMVENLGNDFSPFHASARWGITALVCEILAKGVIFNDTDFQARYGVTPLEESARRGHIDVMSILIDQGVLDMKISEMVVQTAARNEKSGKEIIALLIDRRGNQIKITEDDIKAAAENEHSGTEIMTLLLDKRGEQIQITRDLMKAAAKNNHSGKEMIKLLLDRRGDDIQITEDVVRAAAGNWGNGADIIALLIDRRGSQIQITRGVVKEAALNGGSGTEIITLLLDKRGDDIQITEKVVKAAAGNWGNGAEIMTLLIDRRGDDLQITEDVIKAAAENKHSGTEIMTLLLDKRGDDIQITEDVVKAAAGNKYRGTEIMTLLLDKRGDQIQITRDVIKAAAENDYSGKQIMTLLIDRRGDDPQITEDVVKAAAENENIGTEIMTLLLDKRGDQIQITRDVLEAAAENRKSGKDIIKLLLDRQGDDIQITEDVVKAAAENGEMG